MVQSRYKTKRNKKRNNFHLKIKKRMKTKLLIMLALLCCVSFISAQNNWELHGGLSLPQGKFADDAQNRIITGGHGGAGTGFNVGIKSINSIDGTKSVFVTGSLDFFYNELNRDVKDNLEMNNNNIDIRFSRYINVPALVGLECRLPLSPGASIYGEAGIGANYFTITTERRDVLDPNGYYTESLTSYNYSIKLAGKVGVGFLFNDKYSIGLSSWSLGNHKLNETKRTSSNRNPVKNKFNNTLSVSTLTLTAGIRF